MIAPDALTVEAVSRILTAGYPQPIWYVPSLVLASLGIASFIDARTGRVPTVLMAITFLGALFALAFYSDWFIAGERLLRVVGAFIVLRATNTLYDKLCGHDAFGMGDATWTGTAVLAFNIIPVVGAWVVGSLLALIWMGLRRLVGMVGNTYNGHVYVHFAPFLWIGLVASLLLTSS